MDAESDSSRSDLPSLVCPRPRSFHHLRKQHFAHLTRIRKHFGWNLNWRDHFVYVFPPVALIHKVLLQVQKENPVVIRIAPWWFRREWCPLLLDLLIDYPMCLPHSPDLLTQNQGRHLHSSTELSGMANQRRSLVAGGISEGTAATILAASTDNTKKQYAHSWKHYADWCVKQEVLKEVSSFLR